MERCTWGTILTGNKVSPTIRGNGGHLCSPKYFSHWGVKNRKLWEEKLPTLKEETPVAATFLFLDLSWLFQYLLQESVRQGEIINTVVRFHENCYFCCCCCYYCCYCCCCYCYCCFCGICFVIVNFLAADIMMMKLRYNFVRYINSRIFYQLHVAKYSLSNRYTFIIFVNYM